MNFAKKVLAAGCLFAMLATPVTAYATPAQTSPRTGVPVVTATESTYSKVAISKVSNYVNVRTEANMNSSIVGKIYNNCAATILATVDGEGGKWYQIQSGTVTGYIKAEYFITGAEAEKMVLAGWGGGPAGERRAGRLRPPAPAGGGEPIAGGAAGGGHPAVLYRAYTGRDGPESGRAPRHCGHPPAAGAAAAAAGTGRGGG